MASKFIFKNSNSFLSLQGLSTYYLTNMSYNENYDKLEVTDTSTSGDGKEYLTGRAERNISAELLHNVSASDIPLNVEYVVTASFEGKRYLGSMIFYTKNIVGAIDDAVKTTYEGSFNGAVTYKSASQA